MAVSTKVRISLEMCCEVHYVTCYVTLCIPTNGTMAQMLVARQTYLIQSLVFAGIYSQHRCCPCLVCICPLMFEQRYCAAGDVSLVMFPTACLVWDVLYTQHHIVRAEGRPSSFAAKARTALLDCWCTATDSRCTVCSVGRGTAGYLFASL